MMSLLNVFSSESEEPESLKWIVKKIIPLVEKEWLVTEPIIKKIVKKIIPLVREEWIATEPIIKTADIVVEKKIVIQEVTPTWAKALEGYQQTVQQVQQHPKLASILLGDAQESQQVVRLLVCGAQWSNILRVWDALAEQVKHSQQPIGPAEQHILQLCVDLYNQTLSDCQAQLQTVDTSATYNYEQHQRANNKGERIQAVLLQGLKNAADEVVRSAVVLTQ